MAKMLRCPDLGLDCDHVIRGKDEQGGDEQGR